jgi:membrane protein DedA with SNARE-associated domain
MIDIFPQFLRDHGYAGVYLLMVLDSVFPVFPSELVMPLAGLLASQGQMTFWGVALCGTAGAMTGAIGWYWLARALGLERFTRLIDRFGWLTTINEHEIDLLRRWFDRFGAPMVLVCRMAPLVRTAISIPAGLVRMPFPRYLLLSFIGAAAWSTGLAVAGWLLGDHYERIHHYIGPVSTIIVGLALLAWLMRIVMRLRRKSH